MIVRLRSMVLAVACTAGALSSACDSKEVRGTYRASAPPPSMSVVRRGEVDVPNTKPSVEPIVGPLSKAPPQGSAELGSKTVESKVAAPSVRRCWNGARPPCKPAPSNLRFEF